MSRTTLITTRLKDAEYQELKTKAEELGISISEYVRRAALGKRMPNAPVPQINREAWAELARACANLNQCQKAVNQGLVRNVSLDMLESLSSNIQSLRCELMGIAK